MRLLMLAQFYPPIIGGEERFAKDLSVAMAARGHEVAVVTLWHEGSKEFEVEEGVRIYRVRSTIGRVEKMHSDPTRRHAPPFPDPEVTLALRRIIAQEQPDIVHGFNWIAYSFVPLKPFTRAKFVMSLCDYSLVCAKKKLIYLDVPCSGPQLGKCLKCAGEHYGKAVGAMTTLTNWTMRLSEQVTVDIYAPVSQAVADLCGLEESKLPYRVLPNFVADEIGQPRGDFGSYTDQLPDGDFLLFVGAFSRYKGVEVLAEAHARLENPPPLVIIGYQTSEYPVDTSKFGSNVIVLKNWPNGAVLEAWRRSLIAFAPSLWAEPFGIVVLEAMAVGKPVIASRTGGLTDIVADGETGLLVEPGNVAALAQATQSLLDDPARREQMGQAGRERVKRFMVSSVVPLYEQTYRELLGIEHEQPDETKSDEAVSDLVTKSH